MDTFSIALSGLQTSGNGMAVTANNVANANSEDYKAKRMDQEDVQGGGTRPSTLQESQEPTAPGRSNVDYATEMTGSMLQSASYQANLKVIQVESQILGQTMDLKA